jgi:hypothetical protein
VTEIGEKEKMKNKLLATLVVLMLSISAISSVMMIKPNVKAENLVRLDIYTSPSFLQGTYVTINGTGNWPGDSTIHLDAPQYVYVGSNTRYQFHHWNYNNSFLSGAYAYDLALDNNDGNVTAVYDAGSMPVEYLVTVTVPSFPYQNFTADLWQTGTYYGTGITTAQAWIVNNTQIRAGCGGTFLYGGVPAVCEDPATYRLARFVNWTGVGFYIIGNFAWSNDITVNGPLNLAPEWDEVFYLKVTDTYGWGVPVTGKTGYYTKNTLVTLSETAIATGGPGVAWFPDYYLVDGAKVTGVGGSVTYVNYTYVPGAYWPYVNMTIILKMDTNHTAVLHYRTMYYLTFTDSTGATNVPSYSGWYEAKCIAGPFNAPRTTNQTTPPNWRYLFKYWWNQTAGGTFGNYSNIGPWYVNVTGPTSFMAIYDWQWYVGLYTDPANSGLFSKLTFTGWTGDYGWFYHGDTCYFGAPMYYGQTEWANGTRLHFYGWFKGAVWDWGNNSQYYGGVIAAANFTAQYTREYKAHVSTNPVAAGAPYDDWQADGTIKWEYVPQFYVDPMGWTWNFAYFTASPSTSLLANWPGGAGQLIFNTSINAVANYVLETAGAVNQSQFLFENAGNAFCHTFTANIWITNVKELYALDFELRYNTGGTGTFLEITSTDTSMLSSIWPGGYFVAVNSINNGAGKYNFAATALGNVSGFTGTGVVVKLTFHIFAEPCVGQWSSLIQWWTLNLMHQNLTTIVWDSVINGQVFINSLSPTLGMFPTISFAGKTLTADIKAVNVTKLDEYALYLNFNPLQLQVKSVIIDTTFLTPPYITGSIGWNNVLGTISIYEHSTIYANGTGFLAHIVFDVIVNGTALDAVTWNTVSTYVVECSTYALYTTSSPTPLILVDGYMPDPLLGDANLDGAVDIYDLRLVAYYYGTNPGFPPFKPYDVYPTGWIDILDLITVASNYGHHA